jgi:hypothetical protein
MESTFRTLLEDYFSKGMSLDKMNEIISDVYKSSASKSEVKTETKAKAKKEKEANVSRFSKVMLNQLKSELIKVGVKFSEEKSDEELEGFKKECTKYLNSMDKDTYVTKKIQDHISEFAKTKKVVDETKSNIGNSVTHTTIQVTLEELQKNKNLVVLDTKGPQNTFWDFEKEVYVTGPDSDSEDNDITVKKDGITYYVGKTSGRVYKQTDDDEEDEFVGFAGVGKFKDLLKN